MASSGTINVSIGEPVSVDWAEVRNVLSAPKGLSFVERIGLWLRGRSDARRKLIEITESGNLNSPYIQAISQQANIEIASEWNTCSEAARQVHSNLLQVEKRCEFLRQRYDKLVAEREEEVARACSAQFAGDTVASEYLVAKRQNRRETAAIGKYEAEMAELAREIEDLEIKAIPYREQLREIEVTAQSHDRLQRSRYLWRLSIYAYGASRFMQVQSDMVGDYSLSTKPAEDYYGRFSDQQNN